MTFIVTRRWILLSSPIDTKFYIDIIPTLNMLYFVFGDKTKQQKKGKMIKAKG